MSDNARDIWSAIAPDTGRKHTGSATTAEETR